MAVTSSLEKMEVRKEVEGSKKRKKRSPEKTRGREGKRRTASW